MTSAWLPALHRAEAQAGQSICLLGTSVLIPFFVPPQMCLSLILGAALTAGLTMGLMSLDQMNLEILQKSGNSTEKSHAEKFLPLVKQHHLLLVCTA